MQRRLPSVAASRRWARPVPEDDRRPFFSRAVSESAFSMSVAGSSRSTASSAGGGKGAHSDRVLLPLTLFEYGFPAPALGALAPNPALSDPAGELFMSSPAGLQLRSLERVYARTLSQYINRSVPLAGAALLVLGCGSSRRILSTINRGVARVTFVDVSQSALDVLGGIMHEAGVGATTDLEFVCADARDYLLSLEGEAFDVVIASKCVGLVLASNPGVSAGDLLELVADSLVPGGSFFTDQHEAFSDSSLWGRPITSVGMAVDLVDLATIGGRYSGDVCFSWDWSHPDLDRVAEFCPVRTSHGVQTWRVVHFRAHHASRPRPERTINTRVQRAPVLAPEPPLIPFDEVADAGMPVNAKGVKRILTPSDLGSFDLQTLRPKLDGVPGIMVIDGPVAVFVSPTRQSALRLPVSVSPSLTLTAELLFPLEGGVVYAITGVVRIGTGRADPNDLSALGQIEPLVAQLHTAGIISNTPDLTRRLRGDTVVLDGPGGRRVTLPVDGVAVTISGHSAHFVKSAAHCTLDATPADAPGLIADAYGSLGLGEVPRVEPSPGSGVMEWHYDPATLSWRAVRERNDRTWSNNLGAAIHVVAALRSAAALGLVGTAQEISRIVAQ